MRTQLGVEGLGLFETAQPAPIAPWDPRRFEPPFVTPPLARASDPATSHVAAQRAFPTAKEQNKQIVACLLTLGPLRNGGGDGGGTAAEISWNLNGQTFEGPWDSVIVSRRIAGLRLNDVYSYDGEEGRPEVTRLGPSGKPMAVHIHKSYAAEPVLRLVAPAPRQSRKAG